jgi:hypothetical protein
MKKTCLFICFLFWFSLTASYASEVIQTSEASPRIITSGIVSGSGSASISAPFSIPVIQPSKPSKTLKTDVKAIYLTAWSAGNNLDSFIRLIDKTELNAVVIDIREGDGKVSYATEVEVFKNNKGFRRDYDAKKMIAKLHAKNIYVIGRIVCFKDNFLPRLMPELAIKKANGKPLEITESANYKTVWMNPAKEKSWEYLTELTQEAVSLGFDEIQFDYVRFPETSHFKYVLDKTENKDRHEYIEGFLAKVRSKTPTAVLSADIFGVPCIFKEDLGDLGQVLESIGQSIDYVSPMVYPSHYSNYSTGNIYGNILNSFLAHAATIKTDRIKKPDKAPYEIVYNSLVIAKDRLSKVKGSTLGIRPYLQAFTITALPVNSRLNYGAKEFKSQMKAVYDSGYSQWIFWNARNVYPENAFLPE